ncbi:DUF2238 domain-containing protein [bacterium]|nr:DUF2238 domain-containing protein [bacterium]
MNAAKRSALILVGMIFLATWVKPPWPCEQALHSLLTLLAIVALWTYARRRPIGDANFVLVCVFIAVHAFAARWLYSFVPYDAWLQNTLGFLLNQAMGWERNHFDRLVHALYGVCLTPAVAEYFAGTHSAGRRRSFILALMVIVATGQCYEWFEWGVALFLAPDFAEAFNGQQGDMWDAHKDTLCALAGSLAWTPKYLRRR